MKKIVKKSVFIAIIVFMVFAIVGSNEMTHGQLTTEGTQLDDCLMTGSLSNNQELTESCKDITQDATLSSPPAHNLSLSDKERFLASITDKLLTIPQPGSFEYILLREYGAAFVDKNPEIKLPQKVIFANARETKEFQATLTMGKVNNTSDCYLQEAAAEALNRTRSQVQIPLKSGYGTSDCTRTFDTNLRFWHKYANDSTLEKVRLGKETAILGIVAPPGASQHLWGLAVDLRLSNDLQKQALNQNGWFQTVENDLPHWTYIGQPQEKLVELGFKNKIVRGISYWLTPL
ncbi:MAG: D-alanyl-D-alanine carboxypeptidase family protein [Stigonema ocellatum SAG 48.90 = DSM 106950]|nr:D-alanyl-D-alanine carboxypeptidase family protein [Stigonema ocellatum SAG 48.90 = DSM 106950]